MVLIRIFGCYSVGIRRSLILISILSGIFITDEVFMTYDFCSMLHGLCVGV